jgi:hypothetical protein
MVKGAALAESACGGLRPWLPAPAWSAMAPFLYRCPNTGYRVQGFVAEEVSDDHTYLPVTCLMCRQTHLVNPSTGRVVGGGEEDER